MFSKKASNKLRLESSHLIVILCTVLSGLFLILFGLTQSINIPTSHIDGTYQTASAMYRLAEGQIPGRDFFPYLGLGVNYFLFPIFYLMGSNVAASLFASHFAVAFSFVFIIAFLSFLVTRNFSFSMISATFLLLFMLFIYPQISQHTPQSLFDRFTPGGSLRPIRSFVPYIVTSIIYTAVKLKVKPLLLYGIIGWLSGVAFFWSNDFGIPTSFFLICFTVGHLIFSGRLTIQAIASMLVGSVLGLGIITRGYLRQILEYNFLDVRPDQYWYFGPWTANARLLTLLELPERFLQITGLWSVVFLILIVLTFSRPNFEKIILIFIGSCLIAGGLIASIGGSLSFAYLSHFVFWCQLVSGITIVFYGLRFAKSFVDQQSGSRQAFNRYLPFALPVVLFCLLLTFGNQYIQLKKISQEDVSRLYVSELGGYLPIEWKQHIEMARRKREKTFIEEYWGLWGAVVQKNALGPVDSVIHALGSKRESFAEAVAALPEIITTTTYSYSPNWQPWNLTANYWFYRQVLENYLPKQSSPTTLLWEKANSTELATSSGSWRQVECQVNNGTKPSFLLVDAEPGFYEITLNYQFKTDSSRSLVMVRTNINRAISSEGELSLNPKGNEVQFPVAIPVGWDGKFDFRFVTPKTSDTSITIQSCSARLIPVKNDEVLNRSFSIGSRTAVDITDKNWIKGFSISTPSFVVPTSIANKNRFKPGETIIFAGGETRRVTRIKSLQIPGSRSRRAYIRVFFGGAPLNGNNVGYPQEFTFK